MINHPLLLGKLLKYRVTKDEDMPAAYRKDARRLHDDWLPGTKWVPRMWTAYKVPYPFKMLEGNQVPRWIPYQAGYPLVPGTEIRDMDYYDGSKTVKVPHILMYDFIPEIGQWGRFAAFLDGEWVECFYTTSKMVFGKNFQWHIGLKPDSTLGDFMSWYPEAYLRWK